jgi:hypothetical protein
MTLERMRLLATFQFYFRIRSVEVRQEHIFSFQSNEGGREGGDLRGYKNLVLISGGLIINL